MQFMKCKKCGHEMEENAKVCSRCGYDMESEEDAKSEIKSEAKSESESKTKNEAKSDSVIAAKKTKNRLVTIISVAVALVVLVGIFLYLTTFGGYDRIRISRMCGLGDRYLSELEYEDAIAEFKSAIEIDPKAEDAYMGLADAYIGLEDYESAVEALKTGIEETDSERLTKYLAEIHPDHIWIEATCTEPKYCSICGEMDGKALGHVWAEDVCMVCGEISLDESNAEVAETESNQEELFTDHYDEDVTDDDLSGNTDLVKEILVFDNRGYLSERTEYIYTTDGLVERKLEYFSTEASYQSDTMSLSQETVYTYDEKGRVSSEQVFNAEGQLVLTGTYNYDEEYGVLRDAVVRNNRESTAVQYIFEYQMLGSPIISGEYIWSNFRDIYFNGNIRNVSFEFGLNGEIVECLAYAGNDFTVMPDYVIEYTCDDSGAVTSKTCTDIMNGWGSYSCDYERSRRGIETISYYYLSGDSMRKEFYNYDEKDRLVSIDIVDEETNETRNIIYNY